MIREQLRYFRLGDLDDAAKGLPAAKGHGDLAIYERRAAAIDSQAPGWQAREYYGYCRARQPAVRPQATLSRDTGAELEP
jgi:hypothetical protein